MMTQYRNRRRRRLVVVGRKYPSSERAHAESGEVISRDVLGNQGPGPRFSAFAAHAQTAAAGLERDHRIELRRFLLEALKQREGKHSPLVLRTALDTTVVAFADPVELRRIGNRQGTQHDCID